MKKSILVLLAGFVSDAATAQTHGHISLEMGIPIKEFREQTEDIGAGIKGAAYFPFQKDIPVFLGVGVGYMLMGTHSEDIHEVLEVKAGNITISTIPIDLLVETNNNYVNAHISVRYKAPLEFVQPYVEARGGLSNFYTRTKVLDNTEKHIFTNDGNNVINSKTPVNSTTYNFGVEGGFIIRLGGVGINMGLAYLMGGRAKYYDRSQISQWTVSFSGSSGSFDPNNIDPETLDLIEASSAEPKQSLTDIILINAGVTFGVGTKKKTKKSVPAR